MSEYKAPLDDIRFVMNEVLDVPNLWLRLDGIDDVDREVADAVLEEVGKIAEGVIAPLNREGDEQGCSWGAGKVKAAKGFKEAYQTYCDGGWGGLGGDPSYGGMGMPKTMVAPVEEMVQGACMSFGLAPMLTSGACLALSIHATDELKAKYLEKMYQGVWSGCMDLTEPHAGTDLGIIRSKAEPLDDGSFAVTGTKIFITWGEHDMAENIIHMVLAKLPDAPPGPKGISLFLVPKLLVNDDGSLGEGNHVSCGSLEKKMGIKASATCVMNFDGAKGWLIGEPHKGLACMFTMMNYERLTVGIQGIGVAENSYQRAVAYAKERLQSRAATGAVSPSTEADPIIVHADVRRMLMTMRAFNEGSRAFYLYVGTWLDIAKYSNDKVEKERAEQMVALLTPVAKAFITDISFDVAVAGQQVFGGHGYIREWGQEQNVRDIRITQIYEGTNGIQAMDLIGRKTVATQGQLFEMFVGEIDDFILGVERVEGLEYFLVPLQTLKDKVRVVTETLVKSSVENPNEMGAAAVDYLHLMGYLAYAFLWAKQVAAVNSKPERAEFESAKLATAQFFFDKLLPQSLTHIARINAGCKAVMELSIDQF